MEIDAGAVVRVEVQYDSDGQWVEVYRMDMTRKRSVAVPFIPRRCDHFRLRLSGAGDFILYSITKSVEQGS